MLHPLFVDRESEREGEYFSLQKYDEHANQTACQLK